MNRRAGVVDGFDHSEAFRQLADSRPFFWSEINLDMLITDTDRLIPGTRMAQRKSDSKHAKAFKNMQSLDNRKELIVFLKTLH